MSIILSRDSLAGYFLLNAIDDTDNLLRRVPFTNPSYIKADGSITSFAFKLRKGENGLSVDVERLTTYEASVLDRSRFRLYSLPASCPRNLGLQCLPDPLPDNAAHALITGNFTDGISRQLAQSATPVPDPGSPNRR